MIVRIVRMVFPPDLREPIAQKLLAQAPKVRAFAGCEGLALHLDSERSGVFYSISRWASLEALETYRNSELFRTFWAELRPHFIEPPQAFTLRDALVSL